MEGANLNSTQGIAGLQNQLLQLQAAIASLANANTSTPQTQPQPTANPPHNITPVVPPTRPNTPVIPGPSGSHPITNRYTSIRARHQPGPSLLQPFVGMGGLGLQLNTGHANQARLASSSTTIPRQAALSVRGRRRGPATLPPSLPRNPSPRTIQECLVDGATQPTVKVTVKVYPPSIPSSTRPEKFVYRFFRDSFNQALESYGLLSRHEVPLTSTVHTLIRQIAGNMQQSRFQYIFASSQNITHLQHETLPLHLMGLVSKGQPRPKDNQVRLRTMPVGPKFTFANMIAQKSYYALPEVCIEDSRLVVYFAVSQYPLSAILDTPEDDGDEGDSSGGETVATEPDEESENDNIRTTRSVARRAPPLTHHNSLLSTSSFLPPSIWSTPWSPPTRPLYSIQSIPYSVYDCATMDFPVDPDLPTLRLCGQSVDELARALDSQLDLAVQEGDFTGILSPERSFTVCDQENNPVSFGQGIERETIFTAFSTYCQNPSQWFNMRSDDFATLRTIHSISSAQYIPSQRIMQLKKLGALCGLMLISAQTPSPLDPSVFQFIVNDCNLHSLHQGFVAEWHPELRATIRSWLEIGHEGDVRHFQAHFATYHDLDVRCLRDRDEPSHAAMAAEMLYRTILGLESFRHPEWEAFIFGFKLPCRNGFTFPKFLKEFAGGSEAFLSTTWSTCVKNFESIRPVLKITGPHSNFVSRLTAALGGVELSYAALLSDFLSGTGLPCPNLFAAVQGSFNQVIDLSQIDDVGFRSRMFVWATTGAPFIGARAEDISVNFVGDDDSNYSDAVTRRLMISQGKFSFRTCFRRACIPSSFIINLAAATYSDESEPRSFRDAFDHWLAAGFISSFISQLELVADFLLALHTETNLHTF
ncbi:hypothetical protein BD410DRAFT_846356 [Rickenella mellea]|uniref:HECT domain-containing protein n=1 Tax=Rickenella mellea TaxID=50990 RepID=A0A4Y7PGY6_9AGAM|nr:hypothetical protein BD410DRAFT_846356 [Rickenella mellea]